MTATFETRALYGPPRPVLVLTVTGEVDRSNDDDLRRALRRAAEAPLGACARDRFGSRDLATTVVDDLRAATFVAGNALAFLARERDRAGHRLRLVVGDRGVVRRALVAAGLAEDVEIYGDVADAVLASGT